MTREEAIQILAQRLSAAKYLDYSYIDCVDVEALQMAIEALETPERKKGRWIESIRRTGTQFHPDYPSFYSVFCCTSCLKENYRTEKYCPNCGARMEKNDGR